MKLKPDFITNSSSANFVINKKHLTLEEIVLIKNHYEIAALIDEQNGVIDLMEYAGKYDEWDITETENEIKGFTSMTNFSMRRYLTEILGIPEEAIEYDFHG